MTCHNVLNTMTTYLLIRLWIIRKEKIKRVGILVCYFIITPNPEVSFFVFFLLYHHLFIFFFFVFHCHNLLSVALMCTLFCADKVQYFLSLTYKYLGSAQTIYLHANSFLACFALPVLTVFLEVVEFQRE